MGSRKLVRDLFLSRRQQLVHLCIQSQHQQQVLKTRVLLVPGSRITGFRQFSVLDEFSKKLKGEVERNPELQKSIKNLKEKAGELKGVKDELKVRTKQKTEDLYKRVDGVWTEAEATAKKVSANVKEKISAATEEVSTNVKEKISAATEEVKETLGFGKQEVSGSSNASSESSSNFNDGDPTLAGKEAEGSSSNDAKESLFGWFKSSVSSASPVVSSAFQKLKDVKVADYAKKGYEIVKEELSDKSSKQRSLIHGPASSSKEVRSTRTEVVVVPVKQSVWSKKWEALKEKINHNPAVKRIKGISRPIEEAAEDIREHWETSDHPAIHRIQDLNEKVFGESGDALIQKEIMSRDPGFTLPRFLAEVQEMINPTLNAYLKGDVEELKKTCTPEIIERCLGERRALQSQGMFFDTKILHVSEVHNWRTKLMGNSPIIILSFQAQQIHCVRDKHGSIQDGGEDTILTVYYEWAMQQLSPEEQGEGALYPVWKVRDMRQLGGVRALI